MSLVGIDMVGPLSLVAASFNRGLVFCPSSLYALRQKVESDLLLEHRNALCGRCEKNDWKDCVKVIKKKAFVDRLRELPFYRSVFLVNVIS